IVSGSTSSLRDIFDRYNLEKDIQLYIDKYKDLGILYEENNEYEFLYPAYIQIIEHFFENSINAKEMLAVEGTFSGWGGHNSAGHAIEDIIRRKLSNYKEFPIENFIVKETPIDLKHFDIENIPDLQNKLLQIKTGRMNLWIDIVGGLEKNDRNFKSMLNSARLGFNKIQKVFNSHNVRFKVGIYIIDWKHLKDIFGKPFLKTIGYWEV
ncbi:hypothetical protein BY458DRAFT_495481, partial [Sporodiniella umbellata]